MLDPVADKILLTSSFVALTWASGLRRCRIPAWLTVMTLSRDAIIMVSVAIVNLTARPARVLPVVARQALHRQPAPHGGRGAAAERARVDVRRRGLVFLVTLVLTVASAVHYVYLASVRRRRPLHEGAATSGPADRRPETMSRT